MVTGDFNTFPSETGLGAQRGCHSQEVAELRLLSTYWCSDLGLLLTCCLPASSCWAPGCVQGQRRGFDKGAGLSERLIVSWWDESQRREVSCGHRRAAHCGLGCRRQSPGFRLTCSDPYRASCLSCCCKYRRLIGLGLKSELYLLVQNWW